MSRRFSSAAVGFTAPGTLACTWSTPYFSSDRPKRGVTETGRGLLAQGEAVIDVPAQDGTQDGSDPVVLASR